MTVWLFGDSVFRGAALAKFPDLYSAEEAAAEPLWPLRSPARVMNILLGEMVVRLGGNTGLPDRVEKCALKLEARIAQGGVAAGDQVVMLDIGRHFEDPDRHEAAWRRLRAAARPARVILCEAFGAGARGRREAQHDALYGARSHNDALKAAALAPGEDAAAWLPLAAAIADFHETLGRCWSLSAFQKDEAHVTQWGQMRLAALIAQAAFPGRPLDGPRLAALAARLWRPLGAPDPASAAEIAALAVAPAPLSPPAPAGPPA